MRKLVSLINMIKLGAKMKNVKRNKSIKSSGAGGSTFLTSLTKVSLFVMKSLGTP